MLADKTLKDFLVETGSKSAVPGGGSIAAMGAASAAALTEMVANLTVGKKNYEEVEEEMIEIVEKASKLREDFLKDIDKDANAFNKVMAAFKLPKETDEEKTVRKAAIDEGLKGASLAPLEVAKKAFEMMDMIEKVVEKGNKNAVSDGAVAAMMARTAILAAIYNVKINLSSIKDENFKIKIEKDIKSIEENVLEKEKNILNKLNI